MADVTEAPELEMGIKPTHSNIEHATVERSTRARKLALLAMCVTGTLLLAAASVIGSMAEENALSVDSNGCDLCKDRDWVFVLGTGRSGSTSVMEMVNSIPGAFIAGENFGQVLQMKQMYDSTVEFFDRDGAAFKHGPLSINELLCDMQKQTEDLIGDYDKATTRVIGFKEIRVITKEDLDFMKLLFPCAKIITNWRVDTATQSQSGFMARRNQTTATAVLDATNLVMKSWAKENSDRVFAIPCCDSFTVERFNHMLTWLGVSGCSYNGVLHANEGGTYSTTAEMKAMDEVIEGDCEWADDESVDATLAIDMRTRH
jgi:hypothetical protein